MEKGIVVLDKQQLKEVMQELFRENISHIIKPFLRKRKSSRANYNKEFDAYHGSLENKDNYVRNFKNVKNTNDNYDFTKLTKLLDEIYKNCI